MSSDMMNKTLGFRAAGWGACARAVPGSDAAAAEPATCPKKWRRVIVFMLPGFAWNQITKMKRAGKRKKARKPGGLEVRCAAP